MKHLTREQRYQIEAYLKAGKSKEFIATQLSVHKSTLYREIKRNSTLGGYYIAPFAQVYCNDRKERLKRIRTFDPTKEKLIREFIEQEQWSPEQIVGYCRKNNIPMVSHERIYQHIRQDKQNGGELYKHLRHRLKHRKRPVGDNRFSIKNRVSIDQRPQIINQKQRFGDWEIDTIFGKEGKGTIVTIVERKIGFLMMRKLPLGKNALSLADNVIAILRPYKKMIHSLTSDNGTEFAEHKKISKALGADFYFAHPYASWERGINEYTNKLIRQYIPKSMDLKVVEQSYITQIQHKINRRPRKNLNFDSPKKLFYNVIT
jgi:transposase, IS30 family